MLYTFIRSIHRVRRFSPTLEQPHKKWLFLCQKHPYNLATTVHYPNSMVLLAPLSFSISIRYTMASVDIYALAGFLHIDPSWCALHSAIVSDTFWFYQTSIIILATSMTIGFPAFLPFTQSGEKRQKALLFWYCLMSAVQKPVEMRFEQFRSIQFGLQQRQRLPPSKIQLEWFECFFCSRITDFHWFFSIGPVSVTRSTTNTVLNRALNVSRRITVHSLVCGE